MNATKVFLIVTALVAIAISVGVVIGYVASENAAADEGSVVDDSYYYVGASRVDITGPVVQVNMMGYAHPEQVARGLHTRLYSRAYVIADAQMRSRVAFVSIDAGMTSQLLKQEVVKRLRNTTQDFDEKNVVISGTHSHSGPAGFFSFLLFEVTSLGHVTDTTATFVDGISRSIIEANSDLKKARILHGRAKLAEDANINRSPTSYLRNPESERNRYAHNTDQEMDVLRFQHADSGDDIAMLSWYPSHPTSMNFTNLLLSSDHKGRASTLFEKSMRKQGESLLGKESFVAAFAQANVGDVSPRTKGAICIEKENATSVGEPCDAEHSTCDSRSQGCVAFGPGVDMFDSTDIIARRQFDAATKIFNSASKQLHGSVSYVQQYVRMSDEEHELDDGRRVRSCRPGMGYSFAAGTTDGAGALDFVQGTTEGNNRWDSIRDQLAKIVCSEQPTAEYYECHKPKPVLLPTGYMDKPREWHPSTVEVQMLKVGQLVIAAVPGEFTTMSGRRLKEAIKNKMASNDTEVVIAGLSNVYTHYITTAEEYAAQRYEAASTIYGPHTLDVYIQKFNDLVAPLLNSDIEYDSGVAPSLVEPSQSRLSKTPGVDELPEGKQYGDVLQDANASYKPGEAVSVIFQGANPRQNMKLGSTYLEVRKVAEDLSEEVIFTDADWETIFSWREMEEEVPPKNETDQNMFTAMSDVIAAGLGVRFDFGKALDLIEACQSTRGCSTQSSQLFELLQSTGAIREEEPFPVPYRTWSGRSQANVTWNIGSDQEEGDYVIKYLGDARVNRLGKITPFVGTSRVFQVKN